MYHTVIFLLEFCWYRRATGQPVGRQWHHTGSELVGRPHHTSLWWSERNIAQYVCGLSLSLIFLGLCAHATYTTITEKMPVGRGAHTRNHSSVTIYHNIISKVYTSTSTTIDVATTTGAIVSALWYRSVACHGGVFPDRMCSRYPQHDTNGCSVPSAERNGSNPESSQDLTEHFGLLVDYLALTLSRRNNRGM